MSVVALRQNQALQEPTFFFDRDHIKMNADGSLDRRMSSANESSLSATTVLLRKLPKNTTSDGVRTMLVFAKDLKDTEIVPNEYDEDAGFATAIARFSSIAGASEARLMLNGKPNAAGQANMVVDIVAGPALSGHGRRNTIDPVPSRKLAQSTSPPLAGVQKPSRFNGTFQAIDKISPPLADASSDPNARMETIFSPTSPNATIGHDRSRMTGKLVIGEEGGDDETGELLKDPLAYLNSGTGPRGVRKATKARIPTSAFGALSLDTNHAAPTASKFMPPRSAVSGYGPHGSFSPSMSSNSGYGATSQPYLRHKYPPVNPADQNPPCNTLYVGNLPIDTSEDELKVLFSKQRGYKRLCFRTKQNGPMCFVEFEDISFATKALNELYGVQLHNSVKGGIRLSFSKNPLGVRAGQPGSNTVVAQLGNAAPLGLSPLGGVGPGAFPSANGPPPGLSMPSGMVSPNNAWQSTMVRKLWVRRPGGSATQVEVSDGDLVDNVRDAILTKYANSLGRCIDSPDISLKAITRDPANRGPSSERLLGPEEPIGHTLDDLYPGGQTIDDALIVDVPKPRTPRPSPKPGNHHVSYYLPEHYRPDDAARDYFGPLPALASPHVGHVQQGPVHPHSMAVLTTGQLPALPSPGAHSSKRRPKYVRQHTSSPTIVHTAQANGLVAPKLQMNGATQPGPPMPMPMPTPPAANDHKPSITPPTRVQSPHAGLRPKKKKGIAARSVNGDVVPQSQPASASLLDGSVPPINVLLVDDNVINLKLLEAFMKRLKVRWKSAMNGKEAVAMWRTGGFHLVLMDIQLPVMNGLDATKEIRRLEAVNGIGAFSGSPLVGGQKICPDNIGCLGDEDTLPDRSLFKSPVIIVALTASSLQSDRHEALAAGCNDFLTKPVQFTWMERKVTEWGCMQALIDFDGWRKWKAEARAKEQVDPAKRAAEEKEAKAKAKAAIKAMMSRPPLTASAPKKEEKKEASQPNANATTTPKKLASGAPTRAHKSSKSSGSNATSLILKSVGEEDESSHR
ncbi:hypothetical protein DV735_g4708, partial [Chaetothyriales sp. CBS 134920]